MTAKPFKWSRWLGAGKTGVEEKSMATTGGSIQPGEPVEICVAANELEAQVIKSFLESNDIPVMLQGDAVSKVYGFTVGMMAQVKVFVPELLAAKAIELLEAEDDVADDDAEEPAEPA
ncbi:MAG TPA: DUF2007 domain-containing protein [Anaerolineae bacterium]|nr:DUF2007 domain-containing protein [Anaerolineae bacterium]